MKLFRKYFILLMVFLNIIGFSGCRKNYSIEISNNPENFRDIFEIFWNKMNANYVYWDIDTTNWDNVHIKYKPLFAQLDIKNYADIKKSIQYFNEMTDGLIDNHYYINFLSRSIADSIVYPSFIRKHKEPGFHFPYTYFSIDTNYLDKNYVLGVDNINSINGVPLTVLSGVIAGKILFFSSNHFSLYKSYKSLGANSIKPVLQYFFNELSDLPSNIRGIIIDVRSNQGGDLSDLNLLVGHFIDKPLHFGYTQSKSGNGRLDYTPWIKAFVNPQLGAKKITIPIVVLADNVSASLSEAVVMALKVLSNVRFVGETTWGATGPITTQEIFNDGSFEIPNFLRVQTASCRFKYLDDKIYEGIGFPPDINIPFNINELSSNRDTQLEKAISLLQ
ncbi:peptidase S41-like protein [Sediminibacterium magnilacihabitans]|jgi:carboxyl-terminal processing protease|nr:peptidase S41-like protein [Sediminibacterium magnilacihabitans]